MTGALVVARDAATLQITAVPPRVWVCCTDAGFAGVYDVYTHRKGSAAAASLISRASEHLPAWVQHGGTRWLVSYKGRWVLTDGRRVVAATAATHHGRLPWAPQVVWDDASAPIEGGDGDGDDGNNSNRDSSSNTPAPPGVVVYGVLPVGSLPKRVYLVGDALLHGTYDLQPLQRPTKADPHPTLVYRRCDRFHATQWLFYSVAHSGWIITSTRGDVSAVSTSGDAWSVTTDRLPFDGQGIRCLPVGGRARWEHGRGNIKRLPAPAHAAATVDADANAAVHAGAEGSRFEASGGIEVLLHPRPTKHTPTPPAAARGSRARKARVGSMSARRRKAGHGRVTPVGGAYTNATSPPPSTPVLDPTDICFGVGSAGTATPTTAPARIEDRVGAARPHFTPTVYSEEAPPVHRALDFTLCGTPAEAGGVEREGGLCRGGGEELLAVSPSRGSPPATHRHDRPRPRTAGFARGRRGVAAPRSPPVPSRRGTFSHAHGNSDTRSGSRGHGAPAWTSGARSPVHPDWVAGAGAHAQRGGGAPHAMTAVATPQPPSLHAAPGSGPRPRPRSAGMSTATPTPSRRGWGAQRPAVATPNAAAAAAAAGISPVGDPGIDTSALSAPHTPALVARMEALCLGMSLDHARAISTTPSGASRAMSAVCSDPRWGGWTPAAQAAAGRTPTPAPTPHPTPAPKRLLASEGWTLAYTELVGEVRSTRQACAHAETIARARLRETLLPLLQDFLRGSVAWYEAVSRFELACLCGRAHIAAAEAAARATAASTTAVEDAEATGRGGIVHARAEVYACAGVDHAALVGAHTLTVDALRHMVVLRRGAVAAASTVPTSGDSSSSPSPSPPQHAQATLTLTLEESVILEGVERVEIHAMHAIATDHLQGAWPIVLHEARDRCILDEAAARAALATTFMHEASAFYTASTTALMVATEEEIARARLMDVWAVDADAMWGALAVSFEEVMEREVVLYEALGREVMVYYALQCLRPVQSVLSQSLLSLTSEGDESETEGGGAKAATPSKSPSSSSSSSSSGTSYTPMSSLLSDLQGARRASGAGRGRAKSLTRKTTSHDDLLGLLGSCEHTNDGNDGGLPGPGERDHDGKAQGGMGNAPPIVDVLLPMTWIETILAVVRPAAAPRPKPPTEKERRVQSSSSSSSSSLASDDSLWLKTAAPSLHTLPFRGAFPTPLSRVYAYARGWLDVFIMEERARRGAAEEETSSFRSIVEVQEVARQRWDAGYFSAQLVEVTEARRRGEIQAEYFKDLAWYLWELSMGLEDVVDAAGDDDAGARSDKPKTAAEEEDVTTASHPDGDHAAAAAADTPQRSDAHSESLDSGVSREGSQNSSEHPMRRSPPAEADTEAASSDVRDSADASCDRLFAAEAAARAVIIEAWCAGLTVPSERLCRQTLELERVEQLCEVMVACGRGARSGRTPLHEPEPPSEPVNDQGRAHHRTSSTTPGEEDDHKREETDAAVAAAAAPAARTPSADGGSPTASPRDESDVGESPSAPPASAQALTPLGMDHALLAEEVAARKHVVNMWCAGIVEPYEMMCRQGVVLDAAAAIVDAIGEWRRGAGGEEQQQQQQQQPKQQQQQQQQQQQPLTGLKEHDAEHVNEAADEEHRTRRTVSPPRSGDESCDASSVASGHPPAAAAATQPSLDSPAFEGLSAAETAARLRVAEAWCAGAVAPYEALCRQTIVLEAAAVVCEALVARAASRIRCDAAAAATKNPTTTAPTPFKRGEGDASADDNASVEGGATSLDFKEHHAATRIQARYRGYAARGQYASARAVKREEHIAGDAVGRPQDNQASVADGGSDGEEGTGVAVMHEHDAATRIQARYRGYAARKQPTPPQRDDVTGGVRGGGDGDDAQSNSNNATNAKEHHAATRIQARYRGHVARKQHGVSDREETTPASAHALDIVITALPRRLHDGASTPSSGLRLLAWDLAQRGGRGGELRGGWGGADDDGCEHISVRGRDGAVSEAASLQSGSVSTSRSRSASASTSVSTPASSRSSSPSSGPVDIHRAPERRTPPSPSSSRTPSRTSTSASSTCSTSPPASASGTSASSRSLASEGNSSSVRTASSRSSSAAAPEHGLDDDVLKPPPSSPSAAGSSHCPSAAGGAIDDASASDADDAATKIQKVYRGKRARREVAGQRATSPAPATAPTELSRAVEDPSKSREGISEHRLGDRIAADNAAAAIKIQKVYRGKRARACLRARARADDAAAPDIAAVKIQKAYRGSRDRARAQARRADVAAGAPTANGAPTAEEEGAARASAASSSLTLASSTAAEVEDGADGTAANPPDTAGAFSPASSKHSGDGGRGGQVEVRDGSTGTTSATSSPASSYTEFTVRSSRALSNATASFPLATVRRSSVDPAAAGAAAAAMLDPHPPRPHSRSGFSGTPATGMSFDIQSTPAQPGLSARGLGALLSGPGAFTEAGGDVDGGSCRRSDPSTATGTTACDIQDTPGGEPAPLDAPQPLPGGNRGYAEDVAAAREDLTNAGSAVHTESETADTAATVQYSGGDAPVDSAAGGASKAAAHGTAAAAGIIETASVDSTSARGDGRGGGHDHDGAAGQPGSEGRQGDEEAKDPHRTNDNVIAGEHAAPAGDAAVAPAEEGMDDASEQYTPPESTVSGSDVGSDGDGDDVREEGAAGGMTESPEPRHPLAAGGGAGGAPSPPRERRSPSCVVVTGNMHAGSDDSSDTETEDTQPGSGASPSTARETVSPEPALLQRLGGEGHGVHDRDGDGGGVGIGAGGDVSAPVEPMPPHGAAGDDEDERVGEARGYLTPEPTPAPRGEEDPVAGAAAAAADDDGMLSPTRRPGEEDEEEEEPAPVDPIAPSADLEAAWTERAADIARDEATAYFTLLTAMLLEAEARTRAGVQQEEVSVGNPLRGVAGITTAWERAAAGLRSEEAVAWFALAVGVVGEEEAVWRGTLARATMSDASAVVGTLGLQAACALEAGAISLEQVRASADLACTRLIEEEAILRTAAAHVADANAALLRGVFDINVEWQAGVESLLWLEDTGRQEVTVASATTLLAGKEATQRVGVLRDEACVRELHMCTFEEVRSRVMVEAVWRVGMLRAYTACHSVDGGSHALRMAVMGTSSSSSASIFTFEDILAITRCFGDAQAERTWAVAKAKVNAVLHYLQQQQAQADGAGPTHNPSAHDDGLEYTRERVLFFSQRKQIRAFLSALDKVNCMDELQDYLERCGRDWQGVFAGVSLPLSLPDHRPTLMGPPTGAGAGAVAPETPTSTMTRDTANSRVAFSGGGNDATTDASATRATRSVYEMAALSMLLHRMGSLVLGQGGDADEGRGEGGAAEAQTSAFPSSGGTRRVRGEGSDASSSSSSGSLGDAVVPAWSGLGMWMALDTVEEDVKSWATAAAAAAHPFATDRAEGDATEPPAARAIIHEISQGLNRTGVYVVSTDAPLVAALRTLGFTGAVKAAGGRQRVSHEHPLPHRMLLTALCGDRRPVEVVAAAGGTPPAARAGAGDATEDEVQKESAEDPGSSAVVALGLTALGCPSQLVRAGAGPGLLHAELEVCVDATRRATLLHTVIERALASRVDLAAPCFRALWRAPCIDAPDAHGVTPLHLLARTGVAAVFLPAYLNARGRESPSWSDTPALTPTYTNAHTRDVWTEYLLALKEEQAVDDLRTVAAAAGFLFESDPPTPTPAHGAGSRRSLAACVLPVDPCDGGDGGAVSPLVHLIRRGAPFAVTLQLLRVVFGEERALGGAVTRQASTLSQRSAGVPSTPGAAGAAQQSVSPLHALLTSDAWAACPEDIMNQAVGVLATRFAADVDAEGQTPFTVAVHRGKAGAAAAILSTAGRAALPSRTRGGVLHLLAQKTDAVFAPVLERVVTYISEYGGRTSVTNRDALGNTPLHTAARHGNAHAVTQLLRMSPVLHAQNNADQTPLHLACAAATAFRAYTDVLLRLAGLEGVNAAAVVGLRDGTGMTPHGAAVASGCVEVAAVLAGAVRAALSEEDARAALA